MQTSLPLRGRDRDRSSMETGAAEALAGDRPTSRTRPRRRGANLLRDGVGVGGRGEEAAPAGAVPGESVTTNVEKLLPAESGRARSRSGPLLGRIREEDVARRVGAHAARVDEPGHRKRLRPTPRRRPCRGSGAGRRPPAWTTPAPPGASWVTRGGAVRGGGDGGVGRRRISPGPARRSVGAERDDEGVAGGGVERAGAAEVGGSPGSRPRPARRPGRRRRRRLRRRERAGECAGPSMALLGTWSLSVGTSGPQREASSLAVEREHEGGSVLFARERDAAEVAAPRRSRRRQTGRPPRPWPRRCPRPWEAKGRPLRRRGTRSAARSGRAWRRRTPARRRRLPEGTPRRRRCRPGRPPRPRRARCRASARRERRRSGSRRGRGRCEAHEGEGRSDQHGTPLEHDRCQQPDLRLTLRSGARCGRSGSSCAGRLLISAGSSTVSILPWPWGEGLHASSKGRLGASSRAWHAQAHGRRGLARGCWMVPRGGSASAGGKVAGHALPSAVAVHGGASKSMRPPGDRVRAPRARPAATKAGEKARDQSARCGPGAARRGVMRGGRKATS